MSNYSATAACAIKEGGAYAKLLPHHACSACGNALWRRVRINLLREEDKKLLFVDDEQWATIDYTCYCKVIHNYINLFPDDNPEIITKCDDWCEREK